MKKNLITVIILALVVVNLVLTAVLTITIIPETQKANELITKVCSAIDLDLQAGDTAGSLSIDVADMVDYPVNGGETLTINLVDGYAVLGISLSLDSTNEDYATYAADGTLTAQDNIISDKINSVIKKHTVQEMIDNEDEIKEEILEELQTLFKSSFIVRVNFSSATYQKQ
ncbi:MULTISPECIES: SPFH domain-containing protein [Pseudobutyrivibrio]|jgi:flagellar FliL protein|uniref:SPFH domain-containing protein n=1 Tax=Pseudobutyrivibrio TaxID=46205 RepID=UPI0005D16B5A|nr:MULTISPECIES: SPFH domain-containing protein [Pseudobutyrivibrio]MBE5914193.1 flagellar basal body-associated protein FliL [Pseudobutyrivibrio ruminis]SES74062.1 flagellar FliL protein [Pseudobutyrivibrio sp. C4]SFO30950.1 flagellar FliL protein [Pseudobutyrivibrio sp. JW11]